MSNLITSHCWQLFCSLLPRCHSFSGLWMPVASRIHTRAYSICLYVHALTCFFLFYLCFGLHPLLKKILGAFNSSTVFSSQSQTLLSSCLKHWNSRVMWVYCGNLMRAVRSLSAALKMSPCFREADKCCSDW